MTYILILVIVSAIIAYLGDRLGTWVGKRRLTVLGLRPRTTALIVAMGTGIAITLLTITVAALLSNDVRVALFSVRELTKERQALANEVKSLDHEIKTLAKERTLFMKNIQNLKNRVRIKEEKLVVFQKDEPLAARILTGGQPIKEVMKELTDLIIALSGKARSKGLVVKDEITFFTENHDQLSRMATYLASATQDMVVGAIAAENISIGEHLGKVRFIVLPNNLIFKANQRIASLEVDGTTSRPEIARLLRDFMDELNHEIVRRGMIGNPLTGKFGDLSSESMLSFYDMVNKISSLHRRLTLVAIVHQDTYAIGPLNVSFRLEEEKEP